MSEHTPGPWEVIESGSRCPTEWAVVADSRKGFVGDIEQEADARLVAAAPDLLAALVTLLDNGDDPHPLSGRDPTVRREDIGPAHAAIAKASASL
jgi:hypothetical protein